MKPPGIPEAHDEKECNPHARGRKAKFSSDDHAAADFSSPFFGFPEFEGEKSSFLSITDWHHSCTTKGARTGRVARPE
jgi:hypothetical protein